MNYEVWLMLLGFNLDFWEQHDIEKAITEFGKLLAWQEDPNHLARVIIKARVVDLVEFPWFIVCSEGENFEGDSWTCQCEILQAGLLGGGPPDESPPPNAPDDIQPKFFEFFGFGQPAGPHGGPNDNADVQAQNDQDGFQAQGQAQHAPQPMENAWNPWPDQLPNNPGGNNVVNNDVDLVLPNMGNNNLIEVPVVQAMPAIPQ